MTTNSDTADATASDTQSAGERIDHDQLFKLLIVEYLVEFVTLFFPRLAADIEPGSIEFLDKELFTDIAVGSSHEADIIVKVRMRGSEAFFIIHIENQSTPDPDFGRRMFLYFARIFEKYGLPIYPIVLFSYDAPQKAALRRYKIAFADLLVLNFRYRVVQLNQFSWRRFVRNPNPVAGALMAKMRIAKKDRPKVKLACLTLLGGLPLNDAQKRLLTKFVDTYLKLTPQEQRVYNRERAKLGLQEEQNVSVLDEITTSWEQQGIERGIEKGIQQGMQREAATVASRLLERRFGTVPTDLQQKIESRDKNTLEELTLAAALEFREIEDARAWLDVNR